MRHVATGTAAMPMDFACRDMDEIASNDIVFVVIGGNDARTTGYVENLVTGMRVPLGAATIGEVDEPYGDGRTDIRFYHRPTVDGPREYRRYSRLFVRITCSHNFHHSHPMPRNSPYCTAGGGRIVV